VACGFKVLGEYVDEKSDNWASVSLRLIIEAGVNINISKKGGNLASL